MKSKIQISVDETNQPIIKIEYVQSDDVRDLLVKKFIENFHYHSWAVAKWQEGNPFKAGEISLSIVPISNAEDLHIEHEKISAVIESIAKLTEDMKSNES